MEEVCQITKMSYDINSMRKIHHNLLILVVILLIAIIFFVVLDIANANKINQGMKIASISISGLSQEEALNKIEANYQQLIKKDFNLLYGNYFWTVNLKSLGIEVDIPETVNLAYEHGHKQNEFLLNRWWQIKSLFGYNLKPVWKLDSEKLEKFFRENLSTIHQPAKNSILVYNGQTKDFIVVPSKSGIIVNKNKFENELASVINVFQTKNIELFLFNDEPEIIESEVKKLIPEAEKILENAPIKIILGDKQIDEINQDNLLGLMDPIPTLSSEKIKDYIIFLSSLVVQEPVDAQLTVINDKVTDFALSQEGISLDINNNIDILKNGILNNQKEITLKTINTKPKISTNDINNLGITSLLSTGVSNFSGSSANRITNIKIGAARFNGILLKPNEEFSFNALLGEVGPEQGYKTGLVIKKDKMVPEYGGGLCQVSTTTFRAAIFAGLEITQRYPHAFPVKYYDPQGFDATIYPPVPDLKFINNTPGYILIQTKVTNKELIFEFYGTNDQRKIEVIGPEQYDIKPDGSMKAKLIQKVFDKNGNIIINKTFLSNYKSPSLYPEEKTPLE
ncbi:MAG TPA: VanW family protein [Candidatus Paceibacterota bacterium]|nr:VanW family protein [Candidatus Paceibacterota bacterium]